LYAVDRQTDGVAEFTDCGGTQDVTATQKVSQPATGDHYDPHCEVRQAGQQTVLHSSRTNYNPIIYSCLIAAII